MNKLNIDINKIKKWIKTKLPVIFIAYILIQTELLIFKEKMKYGISGSDKKNNSYAYIYFCRYHKIYYNAIFTRKN